MMVFGSGNADNDDGSSNYDYDDDDDDSTACSSSRQSIIANGPSSGRVPVIDTRQRAAVEGNFA